MPVTLTDAERAYIQGQPLARLATSSPDGEPDVAAVMCIYQPALDAFLVGGLEMEATRKYRNAARNPRFSLVFDDVQFDPAYAPRGVKLAGSVEVRAADREVNLGTMGVPLLVLRPERKWSWGIEEPAFAEGGFRLRQGDGPATRLGSQRGA